MASARVRREWRTTKVKSSGTSPENQSAWSWLPIGPRDVVSRPEAIAVDRPQWFDQVTPHDLFDRDQFHAMIARLPRGREVIISAGKLGVIVGVDPDTGRELWRTEVGDHSNDDLTTLAGATQVSPGMYGGILTPPATADDAVYVATINAAVSLVPDQVAPFGAEFGQIDGAIIALDRGTGDIVWQYSAPGAINGWMAIDGDQLIVPVGLSDPPTLLSLGLPDRAQP